MGAFLFSALTESDYCGSKQTVPIWFAYVSGVVLRNADKTENNIRPSNLVAPYSPEFTQMHIFSQMHLKVVSVAM